MAREKRSKDTNIGGTFDAINSLGANPDERAFNLVASTESAFKQRPGTAIALGVLAAVGLLTSALSPRDAAAKPADQRDNSTALRSK